MSSEKKIDLTKVDVEVKKYYEEKIKKIRIQRNEFEKKIMELERDLEICKPKTPFSLKYKVHVFIRFLIDDPYACEMKCRCGFVIPSVQNVDELKNWLKNSRFKLKNCENN